MEALNRARDHARSSFTPYDSMTCAIIDDGWEEDQLTWGDQYYSLHRYRRASFIRLIDSQGFHCVDEFKTFDEAQSRFESIREAHDTELDSEAREAHPDRWAVCWVAYCGMSACAYTCDSEEDARNETARRLRRLRRIGKTVMPIGDMRWESSDPDDSAMVSDDAGFLYVDHVDNSDKRDRFLEQCY